MSILVVTIAQFKDGDEFICPSHTFIKKGAKPVWADIEKDTRVVSLKNVSLKQFIYMVLLFQIL